MSFYLCGRFALSTMRSETLFILDVAHMAARSLGRPGSSFFPPMASLFLAHDSWNAPSDLHPSLGDLGAVASDLRSSFVSGPFRLILQLFGLASWPARWILQRVPPGFTPNVALARRLEEDLMRPPRRTPLSPRAVSFVRGGGRWRERPSGPVLPQLVLATSESNERLQPSRRRFADERELAGFWSSATREDFKAGSLERFSTGWNSRSGKCQIQV